MSHPSHVTIAELSDFALAFGQKLKAGDVISLSGDLGSGKTTFLFYLLQGLGIGADQHFSSPTFTILNRYQVNDFIVNHVDLYRLNAFEELENLDIIRLFHEPDALTFVEWGNKFPEMQEIYTFDIQFGYILDAPHSRKIVINHV